MYNALKAAVKIFESKYPEVDVDYREFGELGDSEAQTNYLEALKYDLSSGNGPDLIFGNTFEFEDIYGMMDSGTFADINTYLENDEEFKSDLYNEAVINSGYITENVIIFPYHIMFYLWFQHRRLWIMPDSNLTVIRISAVSLHR